MTYTYECINPQCKSTQIVINKPISECSNTEYCLECGQQLNRIFNVNFNLMFDGSYNNSNKK